MKVIASKKQARIELTDTDGIKITGEPFWSTKAETYLKSYLVKLSQCSFTEALKIKSNSLILLEYSPNIGEHELLDLMASHLHQNDTIYGYNESLEKIIKYEYLMTVGTQSHTSFLDDKIHSFVSKEYSRILHRHTEDKLVTMTLSNFENAKQQVAEILRTTHTQLLTHLQDTTRKLKDYISELDYASSIKKEIEHISEQKKALEQAVDIVEKMVAEEIPLTERRVAKRLDAIKNPLLGSYVRVGKILFPRMIEDAENARIAKKEQKEQRDKQKTEGPDKVQSFSRIKKAKTAAQILLREGKYQNAIPTKESKSNLLRLIISSVYNYREDALTYFLQELWFREGALFLDNWFSDFKKEMKAVVKNKKINYEIHDITANWLLENGMFNEDDDTFPLNIFSVLKILPEDVNDENYENVIYYLCRLIDEPEVLLTPADISDEEKEKYGRQYIMRSFKRGISPSEMPKAIQEKQVIAKDMLRMVLLKSRPTRRIAGDIFERVSRRPSLESSGIMRKMAPRFVKLDARWTEYLDPTQMTLEQVKSDPIVSAKKLYESLNNGDLELAKELVESAFGFSDHDQRRSAGNHELRRIVLHRLVTTDHELAKLIHEHATHLSFSTLVEADGITPVSAFLHTQISENSLSKKKDNGGVTNIAQLRGKLRIVQNNNAMPDGVVKNTGVFEQVVALLKAAGCAGETLRNELWHVMDWRDPEFLNFLEENGGVSEGDLYRISRKIKREHSPSYGYNDRDVRLPFAWKRYLPQLMILNNKLINSQTVKEVLQTHSISYDQKIYFIKKAVNNWRTTYVHPTYFNNLSILLDFVLQNELGALEEALQDVKLTPSIVELLIVKLDRLNVKVSSKIRGLFLPVVKSDPALTSLFNQLTGDTDGLTSNIKIGQTASGNYTKKSTAIGFYTHTQEFLEGLTLEAFEKLVENDDLNIKTLTYQQLSMLYQVGKESVLKTSLMAILYKGSRYYDNNTTVVMFLMSILTEEERIKFLDKNNDEGLATLLKSKYDFEKIASITNTHFEKTKEELIERISEGDEDEEFSVFMSFYCRNTYNSVALLIECAKVNQLEKILIFFRDHDIEYKSVLEKLSHELFTKKFRNDGDSIKKHKIISNYC